jgi:hypothetical protein
MQTPQNILDIAAIIIIIFILIGLLQELFFFFNKKLYIYKDLAKLLIVTKKIENALEELGAEGKGMYEKALSVEDYLKASTIEELLVVADTRNRAMHSSPQIENINAVLKNSNRILKEIRAIFHFYKLKALFSKNFSLFEKLQIFSSLLLRTTLSIVLALFILKFSYLNAGVGGFLLGLLLSYYSMRFIFKLSDATLALFTFLLVAGLVYLYENMSFNTISEFAEYLVSRYDF